MRKFHDLPFHSKVCFVEIYKMLNIESLVQIIQAAVIQTTWPNITKKFVYASPTGYFQMKMTHWPT